MITNSELITDSPLYVAKTDWGKILPTDKRFSQLITDSPNQRTTLNPLLIWGRPLILIYILSLRYLFGSTPASFCSMSSNFVRPKFGTTPLFNYIINSTWPTRKKGRINFLCKHPKFSKWIVKGKQKNRLHQPLKVIIIIIKTGFQYDDLVCKIQKCKI